jgi:hypothetical protein
LVKQQLKFSLISNQIVEVKFGQTIGRIEKFDSPLRLEKGATLVSATLRLEAEQTYLSGASLNLTMNGSNLKPPVSWHAFENVRRSVEYNVSPIILVGQNTYSVLYSTAFGAIGDQRANVNLDLLVILDVPDASVPGAKVPTAKQDVNWTEKISEGIKNSAKAIAAVAVVGVVIGTGAYLAHNTSPAKAASILRKFGG